MRLPLLIGVRTIFLGSRGTCNDRLRLGLPGQRATLCCGDSATEVICFTFTLYICDAKDNSLKFFAKKIKISILLSRSNLGYNEDRFFYLINRNHNKVSYHIEFQTKNDSTMIIRLLDY